VKGWKWDKMKYRKFALSFAIGILASLCVFVYLWNDLLAALSHVNLLYLPLVFAMFFLTTLLWCARWKLFLGREIGIKNLFSAVLVGMAVNALTPFARVGGEPVRAYILRTNSRIPFREALASAIAELLPEVISQIIVVVASFSIIAYLFSIPAWMKTALAVVAFLYALVFLGVAGFLDERRIKKFFTYLSFKSSRFSKMRKRVTRYVFAFQREFKKTLRKRGIFTKAVFLSLLSKFLEVVRIFLIYRALGYEITLGTAFLLLGLAIVLASIPSTPGSLGVLEGGMVYALLFLNFPPGAIGGFLVIDRLVTFWVPLLLGLFIGYRYGVSVRKHLR